MTDLRELRTRIARLAAGYARPREIDGMKVFATTETTQPLGAVSKPVLALVAQGAKRSVLADRVFDYRAGEFLVVTLDLPLTSQIVAAGPGEPFLAFSLPLDPATIARLLLETEPDAAPPPRGPALSTSAAGPELLDAVVRLLRLADSPADRRVLAPAVRREIHWWLLTGPQGALVRQIGTPGSHLALVTRAIAWLQRRYDQAIRIDDLAAEVGLSVSSLNRHFRAATSMSPLQYQKQLRLQRARLRLLEHPGDVAAAGHAVGYVSASQFNREYRRLFGLSPGQDATRLRELPVVAE